MRVVLLYMYYVVPDIIVFSMWCLSICCLFVFCRYLPQELLNSTDRHYSADIFSLGLTLYEVCLVPDLDVLPYSGELWHDLREGRAPPLATTRDESLVRAIASGTVCHLPLSLAITSSCCSVRYWLFTYISLDTILVLCCVVM